jgi:haloacetate dehalogenase
MAFEGFELSQITVPDPAGGVSLRVRHSGPPLLLLHGYPETHMMWARVTEGLADSFTVVCPDLRGYGGSTKPPSSDDHETSSKRAIARDAVNLMAELGFPRFGGRPRPRRPRRLPPGAGSSGRRRPTTWPPRSCPR